MTGGHGSTIPCPRMASVAFAGQSFVFAHPIPDRTVRIAFDAAVPYVLL